MKKFSEPFWNANNSKTNDRHLHFCLQVSLEHIKVFLVFFSETSETGHAGPWLI